MPQTFPRSTLVRSILPRPAPLRPTPLRSILHRSIVFRSILLFIAPAVLVHAQLVKTARPARTPLPSDQTGYASAALFWDLASVDARLGPSFEALNPTPGPDTRPTAYLPPSQTWSPGYIRIDPYEVGGPPASDSEYWSDSGQVAYVPDDLATDPGLDRIQTFAYYSCVFATSPRLDDASYMPHPDASTRYAPYIQMLGETPTQPIAMVRNYALNDNEAIVIFRDGLFGCAGTQTSRPGGTVIPGFVFPANKVPTAIALSSENELALVTVWDTATQRGQLAVVALEGKYITSHTMPYMGLANEGSWSDFKLLGYVDLPMTMPSSVAVASNGRWAGPSATGGDDLGQIDLTDDSTRAEVYDGAWAGLVALRGYALVASATENMAVLVDLTPLFNYFRQSYLSSETSLQATVAARGPDPAQFPQTFEVNPSIQPTLLWQQSYTQPTAVLAGHTVDRWSEDHYKAYVATQDGTIHIIDTSSIMSRASWETIGPLQEIGSFTVGRNPISMAFARWPDKNLPVIPLNSLGVQYAPDVLNNEFYVACRGDREVVAAVTWMGQGAVYRTIQDTRLADPVAVSVAQRGYIVSVADFHGRKVLSFRIGPLVDHGNGLTFGPGPTGTDDFELGGELDEAGSPFLLGSSNVN